MSASTPLLFVIGVTVLALAGVWLAIRSIRWAKKGTKGGSLLAAVAFANPTEPPPQQQVEEENRRKKDSESGPPR